MGYRLPLNRLGHWPAALRQLLEDCWAANPSERPYMAQVASRLKEVLLSPDMQEFGSRPAAPAGRFGSVAMPSCGACVVS